MSLPRLIRRGTLYFLTRRIALREFLLRPSPETNAIVLYAVAYAVRQTGVRVHAIVVMSDHIHLVVSDPNGCLPVFTMILHRHIACCMNRLLGRRESIWSSDEPSVVTLENDDAVIDAIAYVIANPVAAGLVADPGEWPGVITPSTGLSTTAVRPAVFYRKNGAMPESIELQISPPELSRREGGDSVVDRIDAALATKIRDAREGLESEGRSVLGRAAVLEVPRSTRATTFEPRGALRPRFATKNQACRIEALRRLRSFYEQYRRALYEWRSGDRETVFPAGTYAMTVLHGARVEPDGPWGLPLAS